MLVMNESILASMQTKTTTNKVKTPGGECGGQWKTNLHTFDNGGHGSRLEYQCEAFLRSFETKSQYNREGLYYVP